MNNRVINEWYQVLFKNSTKLQIQIIHDWSNRIENRIFHHYIENQVRKVMLVTWMLSYEKNAMNQSSYIWKRLITTWHLLDLFYW